jgi:hypothetical protein
MESTWGSPLEEEKVVKRIMLVVSGVSMSATIVTVTFLVSFVWGFIVMAFFIIATFFELERREIELEVIRDYINVEGGSYLNNHSFSIGVAFTIIGVVLLAPAFLVKGMGYWYEWHFFFTAIFFLATGLILTNRKMKDNENAKNSHQTPMQ